LWHYPDAAERPLSPINLATLCVRDLAHPLDHVRAFQHEPLSRRVACDGVCVVADASDERQCSDAEHLSAEQRQRANIKISRGRKKFGRKVLS
jgi:hypothetical protein